MSLLHENSSTNFILTCPRPKFLLWTWYLREVGQKPLIWCYIDLQQLAMGIFVWVMVGQIKYKGCHEIEWPLIRENNLTNQIILAIESRNLFYFFFFVFILSEALLDKCNVQEHAPWAPHAAMKDLIFPLGHGKETSHLHIKKQSHSWLHLFIPQAFH